MRKLWRKWRADRAWRREMRLRLGEDFEHLANLRHHFSFMVNPKPEEPPPDK